MLLFNYLIVGVTRTLGIYSDHIQGIDFTAIELYGYGES